MENMNNENVVEMNVVNNEETETVKENWLKRACNNVSAFAQKPVVKTIGKVVAAAGLFAIGYVVGAANDESVTIESDENSVTVTSNDNVVPFENNSDEINTIAF